jgi:heme exporter protein C
MTGDTMTGTQSKWLTVLDFLSAVMMITAFLLVIFYAPLESVMGAVQKVFYFHVASAWAGMLGFLSAAFCGLFYLIKRKPVWDGLSVAGVEIGLEFTLVGIISGSIWARPIWNTWWTWDPRLTTSAIMVLIFLAYHMLRGSLDDPERRARLSAVYAVIGFISVPLTFFSIRLFRTIHPVLMGGEPAFNMDTAMQLAFAGCLLAFTILFFDLFWHRYMLGQLVEYVAGIEQPTAGED